MRITFSYEQPFDLKLAPVLAYDHSQQLIEQDATFLLIFTLSLCINWNEFFRFIYKY